MSQSMSMLNYIFVLGKKLLSPQFPFLLFLLSTLVLAHLVSPLPLSSLIFIFRFISSFLPFLLFSLLLLLSSFPLFSPLSFSLFLLLSTLFSFSYLISPHSPSFPFSSILSSVLLPLISSSLLFAPPLLS